MKLKISQRMVSGKNSAIQSRPLLTLCLSWALCTAGIAQAELSTGNPVTGKQLAATCIACHGDHGTPAKTDVPKIDRMSAENFMQAMSAMREVHHDLPIVAHTLNDQELADIAAYFTYSQ